jgi:hypothetical protein
MTLDSYTVYVFVRQDISLAMQLVQSNHAIFVMAAQMPRAEGIPNVIVIGVPHVAALKRVLHKLEAAAIPAESFTDPDLPVGITAVCTYPLAADDKVPLANYRLWQHSPAACKGSGFNADGGANADVAQVKSTPFLTERSLVDKPAIGSISMCQADGNSSP